MLTAVAAEAAAVSLRAATVCLLLQAFLNVMKPAIPSLPLFCYRAYALSNLEKRTALSHILYFGYLCKANSIPQDKLRQPTVSSVIKYTISGE